MNPATSPRPPCTDHPARPAAVRCASCGRMLCDDCYRFRLDARAACARCAYEASTRPSRRLSLAVTFFGVSVGGGLSAARRWDLWAEHGLALAFGGVAAAGVAYLIARSGRTDEAPEVERRDPAEEPAGDGALGDARGVYRGRARHLLMAAAPKVSARATAAVLLGSLAVTAVLLPAAARLPRWVEAEIVLGAWWMIVAATLSILLYRGFRLRDDFVYFAPWDRPAAPDAPPSAEKDASRTNLGLDGCSGLDAEGCAAAAVVTVALAAAFGVAWVLVELALPVVFLLMYGLFMRAIGRVANDRHGCEGDLAKALRWGALWSTLYVLPLALITAVLHALRR
ncbi:MAG: B-box zinc finger protein [Polyangiales bacterium]